MKKELEALIQEEEKKRTLYDEKVNSYQNEETKIIHRIKTNSYGDVRQDTSSGKNLSHKSTSSGKKSDFVMRK
jgi:hypothetical protein